MDRYSKVKQIIESLPEENRRICVSNGACACRGCVTSRDISKGEFAWWLKTHTNLKPFSINILGDAGGEMGTGTYLFDDRGFPIGTK